jgi:hypothetical protein
MMTVLSPSSWNTFLDLACLVKSCKLLPYTPLWEILSLSISSHIHDQYIWQASSIWSLLDSNLNLHFELVNHRINCFFSIMMMSWRYTWELTQSYSSRHTQYRLKSLMTNIRITPWITPWSLIVRCWPSSWEPQEEGMMSTTASFPQYETKV